MSDKLDELEERIETLEKMASEKIESLKKERDDLKKEIEHLRGLCKEYSEIDLENKKQRNEIIENMKKLEEVISAYAPFDNMIRTIIRTEFSNVRKELTDEVLKEIMDRVQGQFGKPLTHVSKLMVDVTESELEVQVHREKVTAEESTLRGQIALLIAEGEFDRYKSARSVGRALQQLGYKVSETSSSIISELEWFTQQRILKNVEGHGWIVKDKSRVVVKIE